MKPFKNDQGLANFLMQLEHRLLGRWKWSQARLPQHSGSCFSWWPFSSLSLPLGLLPFSLLRYQRPRSSLPDQQLHLGLFFAFYWWLLRDFCRWSCHFRLAHTFWLWASWLPSSLLLDLCRRSSWLDQSHQCSLHLGPAHFFAWQPRDSYQWSCRFRRARTSWLLVSSLPFSLLQNWLQRSS